MKRKEFDERNSRFNIPNQELERMYRVYQEQMLMEQMMMEAARQAGSTPAAAGGGGSLPPTGPFVMTLGIEVDADGDQFRLGVETTVEGATTMTIVWGDGQTEEFDIDYFGTTTFSHTYASAGSYTVEVTFADPSVIRAIFANAND